MRALLTGLLSFLLVACSMPPEIKQNKMTIERVEATPNLLTQHMITLDDYQLHYVSVGTDSDEADQHPVVIFVHGTPGGWGTFATYVEQPDLIKNLDFFLNIQRDAPFSEQLTIPEEQGSELLKHVISLNKVTVTEDSLGTIISLNDAASLEMRYYRNNILHSFALISLICKLLTNNKSMQYEQIVDQSICILSTLKDDLFLWQNDDQIALQVNNILTTLEKYGVTTKTSENLWSLSENSKQLNQVHLMAECIDESLQRLAIITSLVTKLSPLTRRELENKVVAIAKRLAVLNNITAPEFIDKKSQATLINTIREQGYLEFNKEGLLETSKTMPKLKSSITSLVAIEVLQSIAR